MKDERYKKIMADLGSPNSRSLMLALKQVANEVAQEKRAVDVEALAALEHKQWAHWTEYMLTNLTPENISRWKKQVKTPYSELSETEKESDREWARKVINIIQ